MGHRALRGSAHGASVGCAQLDTSEVASPEGAALLCPIFAAIGLVIFAGLMSGLTLGLLSMEKLDLRVIEKSGDEKDKQRAVKVMGLLQNQHLLLVTLLLCNAIAMEALPLVLQSFVEEILAVVISVTAVLFFGEILPQAICKAFGLAVGAAAAPLVKVLVIVCFPIAWPIAKLLDYMVGHDGDRIYERKQMAAILQIHCEDGHITRDEETVMKGALEMANKTCATCMTPIDRVKSLPDDARVDEATLTWIIETGHSRIPIHVAADRSQIRGVLLTKKLLGCKVGDAIPISSLELTPIVRVLSTTDLYKALDVFQTGRSHMAAVYSANEIDGGASKVGNGLANGTEECAPRPRALGILALEDVLEELLKEEIVDETDRFVHADDPKSASADEWRAQFDSGVFQCCMNKGSETALQQSKPLVCV